MSKNTNKKIAEKLADLFSDNRIMLSDWKYGIPFYLTQEKDSIVVVAKNLADGIDYQMDRQGIDIDPKFVVAYPEDTMINIEGKEFRG